MVSNDKKYHAIRDKLQSTPKLGRAVSNNSRSGPSWSVYNGKMFPIIVGKITNGVNNDNMYYRNSSSFKDLSMSEILKLAEERARVTGRGRQSIDNPWHKRMAISDNITRRQAPQTTLKNRQGIGITPVDDELDNNEEFFENLMKKMTMEQFIPNGKASRLRKRTCLWNKENSSTVKRIKHHKDSRIYTELIPPSMEFLARRLLPRQHNNNSPAGAKIQLRYETNELGEQTIPRHKSTPDPICEEDITMQAMNLRSTDYDSSTATTISVNESFHGYQTTNDCIPACSQETLKLAHDRSIDRTDCVSTCSQETLKLIRNLTVDKIDYDPLHKVSPSSYCAKKSPKNSWNSPRLSTIEEFRELSMVVESTVLHDINMEHDLSRPSTPPLSEELIDCDACHCDGEECVDNVNNNSSQLSSVMLLGDVETGISGILVENRFT